MKRVATPALLLVALLLAGCVYYPTLEDIGGIRIRGENGRAQRMPEGLLVTMDLHSTGKYGDAIVGASSNVTKVAFLFAGPGAAVPRIEIPGAALVRFVPDGAHIVLDGFTKPVAPGDVVIVTLQLERLGQLGVITRVE
jgi:copper(I)-binding protein